MSGPTIKTPFPVRVILHFANVHLTERAWRKALAKGFGRPPVPQDEPFLGVRSLEEAKAVVEEFRDTLSRLVDLRSPTSQEAVALAAEIHLKARLEIERLGWDKAMGRLVPRWSTGTRSFEEALYAQLALALFETGKDSLHRCVECGKFFYDSSRRRVRYCSSRCRSRATARAHRERDPERYREYQRKLMAKRRKEGLG